MNTRLYVKVRGGAPANKRGIGEIMDVTYLDMTILPPTPLRIGQTITISALSDAPAPRTAQLQTPRHLTARPLDVEGTIEGIKSLERDIIELIVSNASNSSMTLYAYLAIPLVLGVTMDLGWWKNIMVRLVRPFLPKTREITLETGIVIHHELWGEAEDDSGGESGSDRDNDNHTNHHDTYTRRRSGGDLERRQGPDGRNVHGEVWRARQVEADDENDDRNWGEQGQTRSHDEQEDSQDRSRRVARRGALPSAIPPPPPYSR